MTFVKWWQLFWNFKVSYNSGVCVFGDNSCAKSSVVGVENGGMFGRSKENIACKATFHLQYVISLKIPVGHAINYKFE